MRGRYSRCCLVGGNQLRNIAINDLVSVVFVFCGIDRQQRRREKRANLTSKLGGRQVFAQCDLVIVHQRIRPDGLVKHAAFAQRGNNTQEDILVLQAESNIAQLARLLSNIYITHYRVNQKYQTLCTFCSSRNLTT